MAILITGGAGYIGSVAVDLLIENEEVIVIDNLSKGKKELVNKKAKFYELDLKDNLDKVFEENKIEYIIHFAAYKSVEESMNNAVKYSDNIVGSINLLNAAVKYKVKKIIFSSTAAVYGETQEILTEESKTDPINFYGFAKLEVENIIKWYNKIHGLKYTILRYFNVAGDGGLNYIDPSAQNVIPIIMEVITGERKEFCIFGTDYDTRDGTCIRDYIHVLDLVDAHIKALKTDYEGIINLGSSTGTSVKELVSATEEIINKKLPVNMSDRRAGDPALVLASNEKAKRILNWKPKHNIKEMIQSTLKAYQK